jgi:hypothetical protein
MECEIDEMKSRPQFTHYSGQAIRQRKFLKRLSSSPHAELSERKKAFETSVLALP